MVSSHFKKIALSQVVARRFKKNRAHIHTLLKSIAMKMKEPWFGILLFLVSSAIGSPLQVDFSNPSIELEGDFKDFSDASGSVGVQTGQLSFNAIRDKEGNVGFGGGLYEIGELSLGTFGVFSLKATTSRKGLWTAMMNSVVNTGSRSFNPISVTLVKNNKGLGVTGTADLGIVGGNFQGSMTNELVPPKFEIHLNTDGWITAIAKGKIQNQLVTMEEYVAGIDLGLFAVSMNMDGSRQVQNYQLASSLGIVHGAVVINRTNEDARSYRAGVSLGLINFDVIINEDRSRSYSTQVDAGILKVKYNVDPNSSSNWKGSLDLSNLGFDIEQTPHQNVIGGRIQIGPAVLVAHRVCNKVEKAADDCKFSVKLNKGSIVE